MAKMHFYDHADAIGAASQGSVLEHASQESIIESYPNDAGGDTKGDGEMSVLEYARFHGLCKDFSSENPFCEAQFSEFLVDLNQDLEDPHDAFHLQLPADFGKERLTVDKGVATYLKSVFSPADEPLPSDVESPRKRSTKDHWLELPILKSDAELDLLYFGRKAIPDFQRMNLPLEATDDERDEGLAWPARYQDLPSQYDAKSKSGKLEIPRETLPCLQTALRDTYTIDDEASILTSELNYKRSQIMAPITPPLLPLTPPLTPFEPSSSAGYLELLSDHTDPTITEARILDKEIARQDAIVACEQGEDSHSDPMLLDTDDISKVYSPLRSIGGSPTLSSPKRKLADLKIEVPLTPSSGLQSSAKKAKSVSFPEMLHEYIPDLPSTNGLHDTMPESTDDYDALFDEVIAPIADEANRKVEQEQLQEADSTMRVEVPVMDFTLPEPPWKTYARKPHGKYREGESELDAQRKLLVKVKQEDLKFVQPWYDISKLERELPWSPFPAELGKVVLDEMIEDVSALSAMLDNLDLADIVDSASLTWKPEGLRILDNPEESEDELEVATFEEELDLRSIMKKRKFELALDDSTIPPLKARDVERPVSSRSVNPTSWEEVRTVVAPIHATNKDVSEIASAADTGLMFGGLFSASNALSRFMDTRSGVTKQSRSLRATDNNPGISIPIAKKVVKEVLLPPTGNDLTPQATTIDSPTLALPELPSELPARPFIISSTLLLQRRLVREIERLYPSAQLIERDFSSRSRGKAPAEEADIILSPATGLLLTTLQKIKQRPLPGQLATSGIKNRIRNVATQYERLYVLVSEGRTGDAVAHGGQVHYLDERDCDALASLTGFAAGLDADVQVTYVAGGEEALARWIVSAMARYGIDVEKGVGGSEMKLLEDETLWELLMRRTGFNALAAQAALASLKATSIPAEASASSRTDVETGPSDVFGLPAFVLMRPEERMRRFETLLGGTRVLARVNAVLEQRWVSAANAPGV